MTWLTSLFNGVKDDLIAAVRAELREELEKWMPILLTGLSKTVVETSQRLAVEGIDKITDMTPSELDDKIVDPVAKVVFDWLGQVFSGK